MHKRSSLKLINESLSSQNDDAENLFNAFPLLSSVQFSSFSTFETIPSENLLVLVVSTLQREGERNVSFPKAGRKKAFSFLMDCGRDGRNTNFAR